MSDDPKDVRLAKALASLREQTKPNFLGTAKKYCMKSIVQHCAGTLKVLCDRWPHSTPNQSNALQIVNGLIQRLEAIAFVPELWHWFQSKLQ